MKILIVEDEKKIASFLRKGLEAQEALSAQDATRQYPAQVARAVSYHALKERMLDLLWS